MIKDNFIKQSVIEDWKYKWERIAEGMDAEPTTEYIDYGNTMLTFPDKSWVIVSYKGEIEYEGEEDE